MIEEVIKVSAMTVEKAPASNIWELFEELTASTSAVKTGVFSGWPKLTMSKAQPFFLSFLPSATSSFSVEVIGEQVKATILGF